MSARNPLQQRTTSRRADELPASAARPYVPRIALDWVGGRANADHRRVQGTLLFADISGFTRLSERLAAHGRVGAEEVVGIIGNVLSALVGEIEQRGGDVLIFAGDALVVLFEGADGPIRAARAGASIRAWFAANGSIQASVGRVRLRVSIGIASGAVNLVLAGDDARGLFVAGPTASRMVRLERAAQAGEILLDSETARSLDPSWLGPAHEQGSFLRRVSGPEPSLSVRPLGGSVDVLALVPRPLRPFLTGADRLESEHRLATIAFVLAGGLDRRFETEPGAAVADLGRLQMAAAAAADRHRITLLGTDVATDGVSLFLVAGAPVATGDDEERMLQALAEIVRMPGADRLQLRAGVNHGPVFAGDVGAPNRRTYTAMGDATNLAARIAARAGPGEILASSAVLDRSATEFESEALPAFVAKGKREPVATHRVGRPHGRSARSSDRLPLTGRVVEFAVLDRALAAAQRGAGSTIVIVGEAGSGKSRLFQELLPDARIAARLIARFSPAGESSAYGGLRTGLRDLAGISPEADPAEAGESLSTWIE
ncbi:MAG: adenylate/guanylate cyclase domain-containing protein, partial [Candidatus Limnocylindrales bacterium]